MFEVEQKFHVDDLANLEKRLHELGAAEQPSQQHIDTYYNHPSRDFAETREVASRPPRRWRTNGHLQRHKAAR